MNQPHSSPRVVWESREYLAVWKPHRLATAPLRDGERDTLVTWVAERFPETRAVVGRKAVEGGVLHRLDTATAGIVLFARTQDAWVAATTAAERGGFRKVYRAVCEPRTDFTLEWPFCNGRGHRRVVEGQPEVHAAPQVHAAPEVHAAPQVHAAPEAVEPRDPAEHGDARWGTPPIAPGSVISSAFRAWGPGRRRVAPVAALAIQPHYTTRVEACEAYDTHEASGSERGETGASHPQFSSDHAPRRYAPRSGGRWRVYVSLTRGFRHQVRVHLAMSGVPIAGDVLYHPAPADEDLALEAIGITLQLPHETIVVET